MSASAMGAGRRGDRPTSSREFPSTIRGGIIGASIIILVSLLVGCRRKEPEPPRAPPTESVENPFLDEELMKEYQERLKEYRKSIDIDFDSADEHLQMAQQLEEKWDFVGAALHYRKATALDPDSAEVYAKLGHVLQRSGDVDGSIGAFEQAVALDPDVPATYIGLGLSRYAKEDLDGALEAYQRSLKVDPEYAEAYRNIAVVHWRKKEYAAAWEAVERCQALGGEVEASFLDVLKRDSGASGG